MSAKVTKCAECGGKVHPTTKPGRLHRYYTMRLELPEKLAIPTCEKCGETYTDRALGLRIDNALDKVYREVLREKARNALESLAKHIRQYKLETLLGLSVGYLSKVNTGDKDPSPQLVALLSLLAVDSRRIHELEDVWGGDPTDAIEGEERRKAG